MLDITTLSPAALADDENPEWGELLLWTKAAGLSFPMSATLFPQYPNHLLAVGLGADCFRVTRPMF